MAQQREIWTIDSGQQQHDREFAVITRELGTDFVHYDAQRGRAALAKPEIPEWYRAADVTLNEGDISKYRTVLVDSIDRVLKGQHLGTFLPIWATQLLTREEIVALEAEGLVFAGVTEEHQDGGVYINDRFKSSLGLENSDELGPKDIADQTLQAIYVNGALRGVTGLHARKPSDKIPEKLKGLPRIPTNSLVATVFKDGKWGNSHVLPDGRWIVEGFDTAAFQYAQGCFEGMVASDASESDEGTPVVGMEIEAEMENGKVTLFRPEESAKRFVKSCRRVGLPPVSVSQYVEAVKAAVRNNKEFIPKNGKLYLRPFIAGLRGGTGIHPATQCLFAVEVSPYGEYMSTANPEDAGKVTGIGLKAIEFDRPEFARAKVISGYAPGLPSKVQAEKEGFNDILTVTTEGHVQECGSSNFFIVKKGVDGSFVFETPTLKENILPGITRRSLIELLRDPKIQARLGARIHVIDYNKMHESSIHEADGAFGTGTAAGITNIKRIRTLKEYSAQNGRDKEFDDLETYDLLAKIKKLLADVRSGKVKGYEDWAVSV